MIRVVIVDDEALVRSGFSLILGAAPDIEVVATADGPAAVHTIRDHQPDVVLLDIRMPEKNGLEVLAELDQLPTRPVVAILTTFDSDDYIAQALGAGAAGFLVKDTDPEQLPALIRSLAAGGIVLSPQVSRTVVEGFLGSGDRGAKQQLTTLTDRERQVLTRLALGESNAEIGAALHLSVGTVKDHVSSILTKLKVTTRLQAALIADRAGLTADPSRSAAGQA